MDSRTPIPPLPDAGAESIAISPRRNVVRQLGSLGWIGTLSGGTLSLSACGSGEATTVNEPPPVNDTTRPTVTAVIPIDGATGVTLNAAISATFSEAMSSTTLTAANFTVVNDSSGATAAGSVSASGNSITFTPTSGFANNTVMRATLTSGLKDLAGNALAANHSWAFTTQVAAIGDTTAPIVFATSPSNGAVSVPLTDSVTVTFSEAMATASLTASSFQVSNMTGSTIVSGAVIASGNSASFTPATALASNTQYRATIFTGATDLAGNPLAADYSWTFTTLTSVVADTTPPTVSSTTPANAATSVALSTTISATFSEAMTASSLNTTSFTLATVAGGAAVSGSVSVNGNGATFTPASSLASNTQYRATISTGATDLAGNPLQANHSWTFTTLTSMVTDTTPPTIASTTPANGATSVALSSAISVTFSEAMTTSTLNTTSFTLVTLVGGTPVSGTVNASGSNATFTPSAALASNTQYRASISTAARDAAGNALAASFAWTFTTVLTDTTPPTVASTTPANGATSVALSSAISMTFSESMTTSTLNTTSFTLVTVVGGTPVSGTVNSSGSNATFTPSAALASNTQYRASISTAARDVAGNALATTYSWVFTTVSGVLQTPALGAHGLAFLRLGAQTVNSLTSPILTTQGTGSAFVVCAGRGAISSHAVPTDSKLNTYSQLGSAHVYTKYPSSGTALYAATSALGGTAHTVTVSNSATPQDEVTLAVVEVVHGGATNWVWNEVLGGNPLTTPSITTTGPATLIAFWWGDADGSVAHTATPGDGFTRIDAILQSGSLVQCAVAYREVAAAGTYSMTWTANQSQGAQLWLVAVQSTT
jgi:Bacterial Ig-like domain